MLASPRRDPTRDQVNFEVPFAVKSARLFSNCTARFFAATAFLASGQCAYPATAAQNCALVEGGGGVVVEIVEHELLVLDDARVVRLLGVRFPRFVRHGGVQVDTDIVLRETLVQFTLGKKVMIKHIGAKTDRYGRYQGFIEIEGVTGSLQQALVKLGLAQVDMPADAKGCGMSLLADENRARGAGAGFWGRGLFATRKADDGATLLPLIGTFQIMQGTVADAVEARGAVTLTFITGETKAAFRVLLDAKSVKLFTAPAIGPAKLKGKSIRVRGWLTYRNGPALHITHPEQLEILEDENRRGSS